MWNLLSKNITEKFKGFTFLFQIQKCEWKEGNIVISWSTEGKSAIDTCLKIKANVGKPMGQGGRQLSNSSLQYNEFYYFQRKEY